MSHIDTRFRILFLIFNVLIAGGCASQPVVQAPVACESREPASAGLCGPAVARVSLDSVLASRQNSLYKYFSRTGSVEITLSSYNSEYHGWRWRRDQALIMLQMVRHFELSKAPFEKDWIRSQIENYIAYVRKTQESAGLDNLGEPRFDQSGKPYLEAWGRPQNDGPALTAMTLIRYAWTLFRETDPGSRAMLKSLYSTEHFSNPRSLIKRDLEFVARHYADKSVDIWEERKGLHYFTLRRQRTALVEGATLATAMRDPKAANHYLKAARKISLILDRFWDQEGNRIVATLEGDPWRHSNFSNTDIAVILSLLPMAKSEESRFDLIDPKVLATAHHIEKVFAPLYQINSVTSDPLGRPLAPAIGRYDQDVYNGNANEALRFTQGHPWVLATLAMSEYYFWVAQNFARARSLDVDAANQSFLAALMPGESIQVGTTLARNNLEDLEVAAFNKGVAFWNRVSYHLPGNGHLPEMINRNTGAPESIPSLAWSEGAELGTMYAYSVALEALKSSSKPRLVPIRLEPLAMKKP